MCSTCNCKDDNAVNKAVRQDDDELGELSALAITTPDKERLPSCRRCGASPPYIVLDKIHIECKNCFLESCNRKIRSTIGRSKLLKLNDKILIAYSGGPSGTALLDLVKNSIEFNTGRYQTFRPVILHIDTNCEPAKGRTIDIETRSARLHNLLSETNKRYSNWPIYFTTVEQCVNLERSSPASYVKYNGNDCTDMRALFDAENIRDLHTIMKDLDLTQRQHYLQNQISQLIDHIAKSLNSSSPDKIKFVFVASTSTKLSTDLLVNVILGEGASSNLTVSICDHRSVVPMIRPLRDFNKKEIAFYLKGRDLSHDADTNLATFADRKSSIQKLAESFLTKLSVDYPATYSTLLRTGTKLKE